MVRDGIGEEIPPVSHRLGCQLPFYRIVQHIDDIGAAFLGAVLGRTAKGDWNTGPSVLLTVW